LGNPPRILIIDDDENIRKVLKTILEDEGYVVDTAETAQEGVEKSHSSFFNLALIDIRLPDMEGVDVLPKLKETTPKLRKIIVTGYPTLQNAIAAVNRNADAYVLKPFNVDSVLQVIKEQLEKQKEEKTYNETKVAEFIESRVKEMSSESDKN